LVITPLGTASKEDTNSCKQLLATTSSQFKVNMFLYSYKSTGNEPKILIQIERRKHKNIDRRICYICGRIT
jgi:hypothetical protein